MLPPLSRGFDAENADHFGPVEELSVVEIDGQMAQQYTCFFQERHAGGLCQPGRSGGTCAFGTMSTYTIVVSIRVRNECLANLLSSAHGIPVAGPLEPGGPISPPQRRPGCPVGVGSGVGLCGQSSEA